MHSLMLFYQGSTTCTGKSQMFTCRWTRRGPPPACTRTASLMRCWISRSSQECFGRSEIASVCENIFTHPLLPPPPLLLLIPPLLLPLVPLHHHLLHLQESQDLRTSCQDAHQTTWATSWLVSCSTLHTSLSRWHQVILL